VHILVAMPSRNIIKEYGAEEFYHIYSRGVAKQRIFLDEQDYLFFLSLFKRYLSTEPRHSPRHGLYPHFNLRLDLLSYCLMPNHVHLLVYQRDATAMTDLLRATMTSYSRYFNRKYKRVGPVFQSRYKASRITTSSYLEHISRYIHLNPRQWQSYPYSSLQHFMSRRSPEWLHPQAILEIFNSKLHDYLQFLQDYEGQKQVLEELKWELANNPE